MTMTMMMMMTTTTTMMTMMMMMLPALTGVQALRERAVTPGDDAVIPRGHAADAARLPRAMR
jgi:hypothetical protein